MSVTVNVGTGGFDRMVSAVAVERANLLSVFPVSIRKPIVEAGAMAVVQTVHRWWTEQP